MNITNSEKKMRQEQPNITNLPVEILPHIPSSLDHESATNPSRALELTTNIMTLENFFGEPFTQAIFYPHISLTNWNDQEADNEIQRLIQLANLLGFAERMKNKIEKLNNDLISLLKKHSTLSSDLWFLMPELPENANDNDKLKYELERLQYVYTALCLFEMDEDAYNSVKRKPILQAAYEIISVFGPAVSKWIFAPCLFIAAFPTMILLPYTILIPGVITSASLLFVTIMLCIPALIDNQRSTHQAKDKFTYPEIKCRRNHNRDLSDLVRDVHVYEVIRKSKTASQARKILHRELPRPDDEDYGWIRTGSIFQSSYTNAAKRAETQIMSQLNPSRV